MRGFTCQARGADGAPGPLCRQVPEVKKFGPRYRSAFLTADLPCNVDHGIIGLMDPAHGPFVHQAWWWRSRASIHEKTKRFRADPGRLSHERPRTQREFRALQAAWRLRGAGEDHDRFRAAEPAHETIRCGEKWFSSLTTITPVTASTCRIDVVAAWNVFYWVPFVTPVAKFFGAKFVRQDQVTMIQQAEGLKYNPSLMLIDDADKPAKWYFALKQARLEGVNQTSDGWAGGIALAELRKPGTGNREQRPEIREQGQLFHRVTDPPNPKTRSRSRFPFRGAWHPG